MEINGKFYSLWGQFVEKKEQWIGGILQDLDDSWPSVGPLPVTEIVNIDLRPNGEESAWFEVKGKDYTCGADVQHLGITAGEPGWITLSGYGGHEWRIKQKEAK